MGCRWKKKKLPKVKWIACLQTYGGKKGLSLGVMLIHTSERECDSSFSALIRLWLKGETVFPCWKTLLNKSGGFWLCVKFSRWGVTSKCARRHCWQFCTQRCWKALLKHGAREVWTAAEKSDSSHGVVLIFAFKETAIYCSLLKCANWGVATCSLRACLETAKADISQPGHYWNTCCHCLKLA